MERSKVEGSRRFMCGYRFGNIKFVCVDMEGEESDDCAE